MSLSQIPYELGLTQETREEEFCLCQEIKCAIALRPMGQEVHGGKCYPSKGAFSILVIRNIPGHCHSQNRGGIVGVIPVCMCQGQCQQLRSRDVKQQPWLFQPKKDGGNLLI